MPVVVTPTLTDPLSHLAVEMGGRISASIPNVSTVMPSGASTVKSSPNETQLRNPPSNSSDTLTANPPCFLPFDEISREHIEPKTHQPPLPATVEPTEPPNAVTYLPKPVVDFTVDDIPTDVDCLRDGIQASVMTRVLFDTQTREERVNPVLVTNSHIAKSANPKPSAPSCDALVQEAQCGERRAERDATFALMQTYMLQKFRKREGSLKTKIDTLTDEYVALHLRWKERCLALDEEIAALPVEVEPVPQPAIRATRRTVAAGVAIETVFTEVKRSPPVPPERTYKENTIWRSERNRAVIPDMLSVTDTDAARVRYNDTNLLVTDTDGFFAPHTGISDWTKEEKEIFYEKYTEMPKQFGIIADFLPHKTPAQCVAYYYLHKKHLIDFRNGQYTGRRRRTRTGKQKANALLADIRQHDAELLEASGPITRSRTGTVAPDPRRTASYNARRGGVGTPVPSVPSTPEPEGRPKRKRAAQPSSRAQQTYVYEFDDDSDDEPTRRSSKRPKKRQYKSAAIVEDDDDEIPTPPPLPHHSMNTHETASSRGRTNTTYTTWTDEDKRQFLELAAQHGDDFKRIASSMPHKTTLQVKNYFQNHFEELGLAKLIESAPKKTPPPQSSSSQSVTQRRAETQAAAAVVATAPSAAAASSMSVLNFGTTKHTQHGTYYKMPPFEMAYDLVPNQFTLDKNGEVRFQLAKPTATAAATSTSSAPSSRIQSSSASSSSSPSVATPPMDSLDQMNAQRQLPSPYVPNWGRFTTSSNQPVSGSIHQSQQRASATEMTHHSRTTMPPPQSFQPTAVFTAPNIQAYGQGSAPFQAQGRTYNYPGYQPYVYTAVQQQQQQGTVPAVPAGGHYSPDGTTVNMASSPSSHGLESIHQYFYQS